MERDFHRYVVVKVSHAEQALTAEELRTLYKLGQKVYNWQNANDKPRFECVVIEHDWPEYEKVWDMLEKRVEYEDMANAEYNRGWDSAMLTVTGGKEPFLLRGIGSYCQGWNSYMRSITE